MKFKNLLLLCPLLGLAFLNAAFVPVDKTVTDQPDITDKQFIEFLSLFEKVDLPYQVGLNDYKSFQDLKASQQGAGSKKGSEVLSNRRLILQYISDLSMYSRRGPAEILPVARFYPNDQLVAVIYLPYRSFGAKELLHFKMALFDLKGNNVTAIELEEDSVQAPFVLANYSPFDEAQTFRIDENGYILQQTYEKNLQEDKQKGSAYTGDKSDYLLTDTHVFQIRENGVVATANNYPATDRVSLD